MALPVTIPKETPIGFQPLPAAIYDVEVTDCSIVEQTDPDKFPYAKVEFTVADEDWGGRKVWSNVSFAPGARPKLKEFLIAVNYTEDEMAEDGFTFEEDEMVGRTLKVQVAVGKNPKTDEPNNNIRRFLPDDYEVASEGLPQ